MAGRSVPTYVARREEGGRSELLALQLFHSAERSASVIVDAQRLVPVLHPNLARIRAVEVSGDDVLVASDLVEGEALAEILRGAGDEKKTNMPLEVLLRVLTDALSGLQAVHEAVDPKNRQLKLFHGRLSPLDIVVGLDGAVRVTSIVSPRPLLPDQDELDFAGYLAPEVLLGGTADARADVYSAGVILWEALSRKRLFEGKSKDRVLAQQLKGRLPRPDLLNLWAAPLAEVAMRALATDPQGRFFSAAEMVAQLRKAAGGKIAQASEVAAYVDTVAGARLRVRRADLMTMLAGKEMQPSSEVHEASGVWGEPPLQRDPDSEPEMPTRVDYENPVSTAASREVPVPAPTQGDETPDEFTGLRTEVSRSMDRAVPSDRSPKPDDSMLDDAPTLAVLRDSLTGDEGEKSLADSDPTTSRYGRSDPPKTAVAKAEGEPKAGAGYDDQSITSRRNGDTDQGLYPKRTAVPTMAHGREQSEADSDETSITKEESTLVAPAALPAAKAKGAPVPPIDRGIVETKLGTDYIDDSITVLGPARRSNEPPPPTRSQRPEANGPPGVNVPPTTDRLHTPQPAPLGATAPLPDMAGGPHVDPMMPVLNQPVRVGPMGAIPNRLPPPPSLQDPNTAHTMLSPQNQPPLQLRHPAPAGVGADLKPQRAWLVPPPDAMIEGDEARRERMYRWIALGTIFLALVAVGYLVHTALSYYSASVPVAPSASASGLVPQVSAPPSASAGTKGVPSAAPGVAPSASAKKLGGRKH
jgi:serine/threonine-protein kinase